MTMKLLFIALGMLGWAVLAMAEGEAPFPWAQYGLTPSTNPACIPSKRTDWADAYHVAMLQREPCKQAQVIFLGDSITMMWRTQSGYEGGTPVWEKYYAPLPAANLGISGDRTEQLLWRITQGGDLEGTHPKVVVLLIGINNLLQRQDKPEQVAEGIGTLVGYLKHKLPDTRILLLGLFPLWEQPTDPARAWVKQVNGLIKPFADRQRVWYLDIGDKFLEPDGTISKVKLRDLLHLSEIGYGIWAENMQPYLDDLLKGDGKGEAWGPL
jgi:lysophospholipase L1-like esterase